MGIEFIVPFLSGLVALIFVIYLVLDVLKKPRGNELMVEISDAVQIGAKAFLKREYIYVSIFVLIIAVIIAITGFIRTDLGLGWQTSICFIMGAIASACAGWLGMSIATQSNSRTTEAARTGGLEKALSVAITGGAVMGMGVVGISVIGLAIALAIFDGLNHPEWVNGYAMGASLVALFARSGGGIYTKGADMGADLVGKVEKGIPEDDPRNPATIADNVGDNVGDVAGLGSDLLESYVEAIIAAMALASVAGFSIGMDGSEVHKKLAILPLVIAAIGILSSIIGVLYVKFAPAKNAQNSLMWGTYIAAGICAVGSYFAINYFGTDFMNPEGTAAYSKIGIFWASLVGIVSGIIVGFTSEYYTSSKFKPVKNLAEGCQMGPAITVTDGIAVGMKSCAIPVLFLAIAVMVAHWQAGFYGIAMAAFGMLATTGMIVSVDAYGPIADNAGGCAEMSGLPKEIRKITDNLDAVGNTTAAIGKGFAIGSAAFAAMGLLVAYMKLANIKMADIKNSHVLAGLMIGAMLPYLFSAMLFKAVRDAAFKMIDEVRRQIREIPGIMEKKAKPDYARCVDIATKGAIQGMLIPGTMAILAPVVVGFLLNAEGLAGMLVGALVCGLMVGIQFANSGGAMDNAKKYIEEGNYGGKGSDPHKAAVVGDTVGDPLKDTVGPSINILIKLMCVISLVLAPLFKM